VADDINLHCHCPIFLQKVVIRISKNRHSKFNIDISEQGKQKRTYKGIVYDSLLEMQFVKEYIEPKLKLGEIIKYDRQVVYQLQPEFIDRNGKKYRAINYKSDFDITYVNGDFRVIDIKGMLKNEDRLKEKMFKYHYPDIDFNFVGRSIKDGGWIPLDQILKARKQRKKNKTA
jgi:hypothetical protein